MARQIATVMMRRPAGTHRFAASTKAFAGRPESDMDAFSEILGGVVLKGAMFFSAEFSAPWGFNSPAAKDLAPMLAPGAAHGDAPGRPHPRRERERHVGQRQVLVADCVAAMKAAGINGSLEFANRSAFCTR